MKNLTYVVVLSVIFVFITSCSAPKIDPMSMQIMPADQQQVSIPEVCKNQYKSKKYRVAVVPFLNNTTYGEMSAKNTNIQGQATRKHKEAAAAGIIVGPGAAGVGYAGASKTDVNYSKNVNTFMRQIAPKIGEFAQSAAENTIINIGGVDVFTRTQMQNLLNEQNFQMNLADQNTIVQFGKLAGVDYIVTGTVDNINAKYVPKTNSKDTGNVWLNLTQAVAKSMTEGWNITTEMTVQLIDVSTGKIMESQKAKGRELGGTQAGFNPELVITAAKKAMGESIADIKPVFSERFSAKAYINQIRGGKSAALITLGKSDGIKPDDNIEAYQFTEIQDFMSGKTSCSKSKIPVEITVSNQVDQNSSWVLLEGAEAAKSRIMIGTLIKRAPLEGQSILKKLY